MGIKIDFVMDYIRQRISQSVPDFIYENEALGLIAEIERLREALLHIAWGGIQSVDDAEKYARKILKENH